MELEVVHARENWAVVVKPAGLHSVPGRGAAKQDSVETRVRALFPRATGPLMVHRLDLETSGLLVVGLTRPAHRALSRQFMQRKVGKDYVAEVAGLVAEDEGAVSLPLTVDWPRRPRQKVCPVEGRPARTLWRVLARRPRATRLGFRPLTGRTHQLRVHAATPREEGGLGHPILGDSLYGDPASAPRLLLHAWRLAFWAPTTGEWVKFESPVPF